MPAVNYQGKESEQSKKRAGKKKPNPKPKPYYLGFGFLKKGAEALKKSREERDRKMAKLKKE